MSRSSLLVAVSVFALTACQPAADAPEELSAETPPPVAEEVVESVETEAETAAEMVDETVETAAAPEADHDHDDEHGADEHDHGDEDHAHDEGEHDHGDEEHAHDDGHAHDDDDHDHDHAGGEAHVHGLSELAASIDGSTLSINIEGALANFDLDESIRELPDTATYTDGTVAVIGGDCTQTSASASVRPISDHGNMVIDLTYDCAAADAIEALDVTGFASFSGFEEVNAVFLTDTDQTAETLTESDTRLDLN